MTFDAGKRLKAIRTAKGLSQRKLALRAGVTNGLISKIENNQTSPSIASLKLILDAIPMTYGEFFSVEQLSPKKFVYRKSEMTEINSLRLLSDDSSSKNLGTVSVRQVGGSTNSIQMLYENYEPGADTGEEVYSHEAEEAGIVIAGQIELSVGAEVEVLGEGDGYIFDSRNPHRFRNTGTDVCIIVSACTPPTF